MQRFMKFNEAIDLFFMPLENVLMKLIFAILSVHLTHSIFFISTKIHYSFLH